METLLFPIDGVSNVKPTTMLKAPTGDSLRRMVVVLLMEARSVDRIPRGAEWQYEPKWDGFRCLLIRSGDRVRMQSKSGRDLARYFPEVVVVAKSIGETQFMLDGELVVPVGERFSFDDLLQRIHPAASRIK